MNFIKIKLSFKLNGFLSKIYIEVIHGVIYYKCIRVCHFKSKNLYEHISFGSPECVIRVTSEFKH